MWRGGASIAMMVLLNAHFGRYRPRFSQHGRALSYWSTQAFMAVLTFKVSVANRIVGSGS